MDIDPDCMEAFKKLYKRIYRTSCPKFNEEAFPQTKIGRWFVRMISSELTAETEVMQALVARYESLKDEPLDVRDSLLLATQMHIFRNVGFIFLKFCHDKHPFPRGTFSKEFVENYLTNAELSRADKDDRPDVDTFEGLFEMSERMKHHVDGFTFRATYMRFNSTAEQRDHSAGADDASYGDSEDEGQLPPDDSDVESASDHDVPAATYVTSPGPTRIEHMHAAAQAQGSPSKVREFEESVRGSDEAKKKKKRELEEAEKLMEKRAAKDKMREPEKAPEKRTEPEKTTEKEPEKEKKKRKKKKNGED